MNKRLLSIIISAVVALLAVVMINTYLNREKKRYQIQLQETSVVIANQDIPAGTTIQPNMLKAVNFPVQYLQPAVVQDPREAFGKIAAVDILKGEQVLGTKLTRVARVDSSTAVRLPPGTRAFTLKFSDPLMSVAGQIKVGDHVDIIGTFPYTQNVSGKAVTENVSVTLFQYILVMGINSDVFTFSLTPQQCALLSYAVTQGALRLVLRQSLDSNIETIPPIESTALWQYILSTLGQQLVQPQQNQQEPVPPPEPAPPQTLKIYKGSKQEQMEIRK